MAAEREHVDVFEADGNFQSAAGFVECEVIARGEFRNERAPAEVVVGALAQAADGFEEGSHGKKVKSEK